jgi:hypothetical protein
MRPGKMLCFFQTRFKSYVIGKNPGPETIIVLLPDPACGADITC